MILFLLLATTPIGAVFGSEAEGESKPVHPHSQMPATTPGTVGVFEKAGAKIPSHLSFSDENGNPVQIGQLMDRPTILLPVYYNCPGVCGVLMSSLAMVLRRLSSHDWQEYRAITVSFDAEDNAAMAARTRDTYLNLLDPLYPRNNWRFLTGSQMAIDHLLDSLGYKVDKVKQHLFSHPNALIVLSADGTIIRYIYGTRFLPFDLGMALSEAEKGTPGVSMKKILTYCFEYDPNQKRYAFQYIRVFGIIIPFLLFAFYFFFLRKGNQQSDRPTS